MVRAGEAVGGGGSPPTAACGGRVQSRHGGTMGTNDVARGPDPKEMRAFTRAVLDDLIALERLIQQGQIESGVRRIGAEQEMFLIDESRQPAPVAVEVLEALTGDERMTTELARFNLEANLTPQVFGPECLRKMEEELNQVLAGHVNGKALGLTRNSCKGQSPGKGSVVFTCNSTSIGCGKIHRHAHVSIVI